MGFHLLSEKVKIHLSLCHAQLSQHPLLEMALTPHRGPSTQGLHVFPTLLCSLVYSGCHFLPCRIISWIEILRTFHQISCRYSCFFLGAPLSVVFSATVLWQLSVANFPSGTLSHPSVCSPLKRCSRIINLAICLGPSIKLTSAHLNLYCVLP